MTEPDTPAPPPDRLAAVATVAESGSLARRVAASAAQEQAPGDPTQWAFEHRWQIAAAPGWAAAWDSALASGIPDPGADEAVVSDLMITARVQQMLAEETP